jgi:hypothetical protein
MLVLKDGRRDRFNKCAVISQQLLAVANKVGTMHLPQVNQNGRHETRLEKSLEEFTDVSVQE